MDNIYKLIGKVKGIDNIKVDVNNIVDWNRRALQALENEGLLKEIGINDALQPIRREQVAYIIASLESKYNKDIKSKK